MQQIDVYFYEAKIGSITLLSGDRSVFVFDDSYINNRQRPTLSQSFINKSGELITDIRPTQLKLPPFFSNLLPEGYLRDYLAKQAGVNSEKEFYLLQALGADLPGAITIKSSQQNQEHNIAELQHFAEEEQDRILHFSLAGIQLKFSAVLAAQGGLTIPAHGVGGAWIIKLPSARFPHVPENEYSMLQLAQTIGLSIPEIQLININEIANLPYMGEWQEKKALVIKRFDRKENGEHIHIEDFAQVYGVYPHHKYNKVSYNNIANMLFNTVGETGLKEFIKRVTFNTLIGNADMHLKNWSFIYEDSVTPSLAPGYDFVSTIPYLLDPYLALTLANTKSMYEYDIPLLQKFAEKAKVPVHIVIDSALETAALTRENWLKSKKHFALSPEIINAIEQHMLKVPLLKRL